MSVRWFRQPDRDLDREKAVQQQQEQRRRSDRNRLSTHGCSGHGFPRDAPRLKRSLSTFEDDFPAGGYEGVQMGCGWASTVDYVTLFAAVPLLLDVVRGPGRVTAEEELQETLREKLRLLQADSTEVSNLLLELSAQLVSINSEDKSIDVTFRTFEEVWRFTTYHSLGFLSHCLEDLLLDQEVWLKAPEENVAIEVCIHEEALGLFYRGMLMQEGSLFGSCSVSQMFDSSTSGADLYLEKGDIAQFEPPFLGSGWTVLCLGDGARGTTPKPALEPLIPFHQWVLKSCAEAILVGDGKPSGDFPCDFARGRCVSTRSYDAEGPGELSLAAGEQILVVGLLVSSLEWFTGKKLATGEVGLMKTSFVKPFLDISDSVDASLDSEEWTFGVPREEEVVREVINELKKRTRNDAGHKYKLDTITYTSAEEKPCNSHPGSLTKKLRKRIKKILSNDAHGPPDRVSSLNGIVEKTQIPAVPRFIVPDIAKAGSNPENFVPLFSFLDGSDYKEEFGFLYELSPEKLTCHLFEGRLDGEQLEAFLGSARETARKRRLSWIQARLCFVLGRLCAGKLKLSQARVYFEEALSVPKETFADLRLLASIYSNLATIYLLQNNRVSFFGVAERLSAFLLGLPCCLSCLEEDFVLKYILKKAILSHNPMTEAYACYLLAKHHWARDQADLVVPYLERLLVIWDVTLGGQSFSPSHGYLTLSDLYRKHNLPSLSMSSARRACLHRSASLYDCLSAMLLVLRSLQPAELDPSLPPEIALYLHQALAFTEVHDEAGGPGHLVLTHQLTLSLCQLFQNHRMVDHAVHHMQSLIKSTSLLKQIPMSLSERVGVLIWLACLHIDHNQPRIALDVLDSILDHMPQQCKTSEQGGVVLNMRGVALRCTGNHRGAAESFQAAINICRECDYGPNWAIAQANLGLLCRKVGAGGLAQRYLTEAVRLFCEINPEHHEVHFITVLLKLGQHCVEQQQLEFGKGCFEWALLLAIGADLVDCQLRATTQLYHLSERDSSEQVQSIIYKQHQIQLLRRTGNRGEEGEALEAVGQLYLTLDTQRAYRTALDFTKSSLMIFIDLGWKEKEAFGWLKAGKIYHLLGQTELVDIYIQAAQDVALSTGDTGFILNLLEAAGDIFWDSCQEPEKAITFYRDRALPIAVKTNNTPSRLRLSNKLTEVMMSLNLHAEAVEFAHTALEFCINLGERLNERVAHHRLASIYHHLDQFELAEHHYLKALSLCPVTLEFDEETLYYVKVYQTLGDITFYDLKDPFDAAGYFHLALAAAMDLGNKRSQLLLCTRLATIYHNFLLDRELSLFYYQKARSFATELNVKRVNISSDQRLGGGLV